MILITLIPRWVKRWHFLVGGMVTAVTALTLFLTLFQHSVTLAAPGDPVAAIDCGSVYTTTVYAEGLSSPDGLAFGPDGLLYVAEETPGRVSQVDAAGVVTPVLTGLVNPEGVAFDTSGNLYVVEDALPNGRLIRRTPAGVTTTLTSALVGSEGVVAAPDGMIYVTESNAEEFITKPEEAANARAYVTAVSSTGIVTRMVESQPVLTPIGGNVIEVEFLSFSGIALGEDGLLYVANESSGLTATGSDLFFTYIITTTKSIIIVDPQTAGDTLFSSNLVAVEGLRFSQTGAFPLFAAEEDLDPNDDNIGGRLSQVDGSGSPTAFCTGFGNIEDVIVDSEGRLYVSESVGGNGRIVRIAKVRPYTVLLPIIVNEEAA